MDGFQGREKEAVIISLTRSNEKGKLLVVCTLNTLRATRKVAISLIAITRREQSTHLHILQVPPSNIPATYM